MRVTGDQINSLSTSSRMRPAASQAAANEAEKAKEATSSSRALIPLSPVRSTERTQTIVRQPVNFLAHLIATQQASPQTRERRRVEPQIAVAVYAAAGSSVRVESSHALSRAM